MKLHGRAVLHCALAAIFLCLAGFPSVQGASALVQSVKGSPQYVRNGLPVRLKAGDIIPDDVLITTGSGESVQLVLDGSSRMISIGQNSRFRINMPKFLLNLDQGQMVGSVRRSDAQPAGLTVLFPQGTVNVKAGDFSVNTLEHQVSVLSGTADFTAPGQAQSTQVAAGSMLVQESTGAAVSQLPSASTASLTAQVASMITQQRTVTQTMKAASSGGGFFISP